MLLKFGHNKAGAATKVTLLLSITTDAGVLLSLSKRLAEACRIDGRLADSERIFHVVFFIVYATFVCTEESQAVQHVCDHLGQRYVTRVVTFSGRTLRLVITILVPGINTRLAVRCLALLAHLWIVHDLEANLAGEVIDEVFGRHAHRSWQHVFKS